MDALLLHSLVTGEQFPIQQGGQHSTDQPTTDQPTYTMKSKLMGVLLLVCFIAAMYVTYKRNDGFNNVFELLFAYCFSTGYLLYAYFVPSKKDTLKTNAQSVEANAPTNALPVRSTN